MGKAGPRRVRSYGSEFKLRAVQLSEQQGVLVRDVAESLFIHPFMLSRWRKQAQDLVDLLFLVGTLAVIATLSRALPITSRQ